MALNCKFHLKYPNKEFSCLFLLINHKPYKQFKYYLIAPHVEKTISIPTKCWDSKKQKPIKPSQQKYKIYTADIELAENVIEKIKSNIKHIITNASLNSIELTNEYLRKELDKRLEIKGKIQVEESPSLVSFYERKIKGMEDGTFVQSTNGKKYEKGTIDSHTTCLKCLQEFDRINKRITYFEDINNSWYDDYVKFLLEEQEIFDDKGELDYVKEPLGVNTIGSKHIKNLKFIMKRALKEGVSNSTEYERDYFIRPREESYSIALNEDELQAIYKTQALNIKEQITKDLFLVGAYTCLRYSDFSVIKPNNFKNIIHNDVTTEVIEKSAHKTKGRVIIPILWDELKEILQRYNYNLPYINSVELNKNIKNIAQRAGIDKIEEYHQTKGGITELIKEPRYNLVSSHTARRSGATNLVLRGYTYDEVRKITGHSSNDMLQKYIKIDSVDNAVSMAENFNKGKKNEK
ncbi:phage integrase SAM-like domain-containing protein [Dysgonomonas sp. 511]|uniref:phage integrase SAM-like domain-containing protein n=1 Tax=Dysgonomonas sp. 511 TaxID=2302930 RepID=UPI0013D850A2|nr:phage integrase SAM-like domain-containing protein [Dysgonomonas sp. 511]NDV78761.1 hypothetical protein [Dysgonomonas sp. 511]